MLDETALRLPDFREDIPIALADGATWHLPRPIVEFGLKFGDDGRPMFQRKELGYGPGYMELLDQFYEADGPERLNMLAEMACRLFRLNYNLDDDALTTLLTYVPSNPANYAMWEKIRDIATGQPVPIEGPEGDGFD